MGNRAAPRYREHNRLMRLIIVIEARFVRTPDGALYDPVLTTAFWNRYLAVFDTVLVVTRIKQASVAPDGWHRVDGPNVTFHALPHYIGPLQYLLSFVRLRRAIRGVVRPGDAVLMRLPSQLAGLVEAQLVRKNHPFGAEVVGDPADAFARGAIRHPLRRLFRWHFPRKLRRQCRRAAALGYVTEFALQRRYPPGPDAFSTNYSSIELPAAAFARRSPEQKVPLGDLAVGDSSGDRCARPLKVIFIGSLEQMYKAPDVLLQAVAACRDAGMSLELDIVGGGRHLHELERMASSLDLRDCVRFHGAVPSGQPIRDLLDDADLFVLPSHTEGLPRAMIEAMAWGLPCIGTDVGGIPELLPKADMVPPGDISALAAKVREIAADPDRMRRMAIRNQERAQDFADHVLRRRREAVYAHLRQVTEDFIATEGRA